MFATRIRNASTSVIVCGYGVASMTITDKEGEEHEKRVVIWLELAPGHPKVLGAIWASLVLGEPLTLIRPEESNIVVYGLHRKYKKLTAEAPELNVGRVKAKLTRLIAPEACEIAKPTKPFVVLEWRASQGERSVSAGTALAAMLERGTAYPIQLEWGDYLLSEAIIQEFATPLITGGTAPKGYLVNPAPWGRLIAEGLRTGQIRVPEKVAVVAPQSEIAPPPITQNAPAPAATLPAPAEPVIQAPPDLFIAQPHAEQWVTQDLFAPAK
jgi:hypothetical protein